MTLTLPCILPLFHHPLRCAHNYICNWLGLNGRYVLGFLMSRGGSDGKSPEAKFLDEIQTKVLRVFRLVIHSHLYIIALRFIFLQTHATSYSFYS